MNKIKKTGYSLIELVIVIAIMAIFVGMVSLSVGLLSSTDTKKTANGINNGLTELKSYTMANSGSQYMYLYKTDDTIYTDFSTDSTYDVGTNGPGTKIGGSRVNVKYYTTSDDPDGEGHDLGSTPVRIQIRKKDGSYLSDIAWFKVYTGDDASDPDYKIRLVKDTGLHYIND